MDTFYVVYHNEKTCNTFYNIQYLINSRNQSGTLLCEKVASELFEHCLILNFFSL